MDQPLTVYVEYGATLRRLREHFPAPPRMAKGEGGRRREPGSGVLRAAEAKARGRKAKRGRTERPCP